MELNEYQVLAVEIGNNDISLKNRRLDCVLRFRKVQELENTVKKHLFRGCDETETGVKVLDIAGDCLCYLTQLINQYNLSLEQVAQHNLTKLRRRYREGFGNKTSPSSKTPDM